MQATQVAFTRLPDDQEHWADTIGFLATCFIEDFSSNFTLKTIQINKHSITEIMTLSLHKIINYTAHRESNKQNKIQENNKHIRNEATGSLDKMGERG